VNGYEAVIRDVKGCGRGVRTRWDLGCRLTEEGSKGGWGVEGICGTGDREGGIEGSEGVCGSGVRYGVKQTGIIRILLVSRSSSFCVQRNLSNHTDRQARTRDTVLVNNREMTGRIQTLRDGWGKEG
jgi:hypothetical protein